MFMHNTVQRLQLIKEEIKDICIKKQLKTKPEIIAITKTFSIEKVLPLIEIGHIHYGENKIQEAENKWIDVKKNYPNLKLHMVGKLQSNKAKKAVDLFDYIHSLDSSKLAKKISQYENEINKKTKLFIQINLAEESQKSGILINDLAEFYNFCVKDLSLNIIGLMCLPPFNTDTKKYFEILAKASSKYNLSDLSMGMSDDYVKAVYCGSTFLRLGTTIFGKRKS
tara:strand:+ start:684 stop:1355 length:672 start_codon:yes stop_codon:yes gene_type:complete